MTMTNNSRNIEPPPREWAHRRWTREPLPFQQLTREHTACPPADRYQSPARSRTARRPENRVANAERYRRIRARLALHLTGREATATGIRQSSVFRLPLLTCAFSPSPVVMSHRTGHRSYSALITSAAVWSARARSRSVPFQRTRRRPSDTATRTPRPGEEYQQRSPPDPPYARVDHVENEQQQVSRCGLHSGRVFHRCPVLRTRCTTCVGRIPMHRTAVGRLTFPDTHSDLVPVRDVGQRSCGDRTSARAISSR